jgi:hypothetical protein
VRAGFGGFCFWCYEALWIFGDTFVIDRRDAASKGRIEQLGIKGITNTVMKSLEDKVSLAKATLQN